MLAYEPVWAIGTGKVATPTQAQEVCYVIPDDSVSCFINLKFLDNNMLSK